VWCPLTALGVRGERQLVTVLSADLVARAGLHIVRGELAEAADVLGLIGSVARALTFYRSVGATRYVRQGESLVAVAS
jgi:hypothetical protein